MFSCNAWNHCKPNFDKHLLFSCNQVNGYLENSGRGILLHVVNKSVYISGGPLSYEYRLKEMVLHYGRENDRGSEHTISGHQFPAEIQLYLFNSQLYPNWTAAQSEANGVLAIGILIAHTQQSIGGNAQLKHMTHTLKNITNRGLNQLTTQLLSSQMLSLSYQYFNSFSNIFFRN